MPQELICLNDHLISAAKLRVCETAGRAPLSWLCFGHGRAGFGTFAMKVKIEIDCTPIEARDFLGLPDVKPMQEAMMDQMQAKMQENIANFTPDALMRTWFSFDPKMAERFQDLFMNMTGLGARKDK
jgi:hypothetical protein